jgi:uncharacterized protein (DUF433 family)
MTKLITKNPNVLGGRPVFRGTRVPVEVVFENLADGLSLDEIVTSYPSLSREDVVAVIGQAGELLVELGEVEAIPSDLLDAMRLVRESVDVDLDAPLDAHDGD